jgi:hypothetical protein
MRQRIVLVESYCIVLLCGGLRGKTGGARPRRTAGGARSCARGPRSPSCPPAKGQRSVALSHCRFARPLIRFVPYALPSSVPLSLKRRCDRNPPRLCADHSAAANRSGHTAQHSGARGGRAGPRGWGAPEQRRVVLPGGAGNHRFWRLRAPHAHTKAPYKTDLLWEETLRAPKRPGRAQTEGAQAS